MSPLNNTSPKPRMSRKYIPPKPRKYGVVDKTLKRARRQVDTMSEEIMETANILLTFLGDENHVNQIFYFLYGREDYAIKKKVDLQFILPKMMWELQEKYRSERALRKQYSSEVRINRRSREQVRAQYKRYKTKINDLQTDRIDSQTEIIDLRTEIIDLRARHNAANRRYDELRSLSNRVEATRKYDNMKRREEMNAFVGELVIRMVVIGVLTLVYVMV